MCVASRAVSLRAVSLRVSPRFARLQRWFSTEPLRPLEAFSGAQLAARSQTKLRAGKSHVRMRAGFRCGRSTRT
jgi:hypothetical protein